MSAGRRRGVWVVLALVVVLVGLAAVADRAAARYAEQRLAEQAATWATRAGAPADEKPTVHVEGVPFLDQVVRGRYDGVRITARDVGAGGLVASRLDVHLTGVRLPFADLRAGDLSRATASEVTATAHIPLSEFATALSPRGVEVGVVGDRLRIQVPFEIAGFHSTVTSLADVEASGGKLRVHLSDLRAAGAKLPQSVADAVSQQLSTIIEAPALPYGLELDQVHVTSEGLVATATGRDVALKS
ncbi:MAG TPA: DUF2993 domain-containing protein [Mycobacteriales bacterium]|nr:DUF2993 domain-containing protein [Mycobacteriales bacterium]